MPYKDKELHKMKCKEYKLLHKDELKRKRIFNRDKLTTYMREYYKTHKEEAEYYREKHKLEMSIYQKEHYKNHKTEKSKYNKEHYKECKDRINNTNKRYYNNHKQEAFERVLKRKRNIVIVEHVSRVKLQEMYDNKCVFCGQDLDNKFHTDHLLPVSRYAGIGHKCPHSYGNCAPTCPTCNLEKHDKTPLEFIWEKELVK